MALPLCVRVDAADERSNGALAADGWREIETLNVFERVDLPGPPAKPAPNIVVQIVRPGHEHAALAAEAVSGARESRLWRDSLIETKDALELGSGWVAECWLAPSTIRWLGLWCGQPAGFLMIRYAAPVYRIGFFAVRPEFRDQGIGRALLAAAMAAIDGRLRAGTQHDNAAATRLYLTSGFTIIERWKTWHK